jgi:hypothetical protein
MERIHPCLPFLGKNSEIEPLARGERLRLLLRIFVPAMIQLAFPPLDGSAFLLSFTTGMFS